MLKFNFLETGHIFIILDEEKFTIKSSDKRSPALKELLMQDPIDENAVWQVVDPLRNVGTKHLNRNEGSTFIKDVKLPVKIEKMFKENFSNSLQNKRIYNALLTEINQGRNDLQQILLSDSYSPSNEMLIADDNGLILFINRYESDYHKDSFFNLRTLPSELKKRLLEDHKGDLPSLLKSLNVDPKFIPKLLSYWRDKKEGEKFPWIMIYLYMIFDGVVDKQNLHKFLLSKHFEFFTRYNYHWQHYYLQDSNIAKVKKFLKEVLCWSDASLFSEFDKDNLVISHLNNISSTYFEMMEHVEGFADTFNVNRWTNLPSLTQLQTSLYHFKTKYKRNYLLKQSDKWSEANRKNWFIGRYRIVVAQTSHDLIDWSEKMSNCIHGYDKGAAKGDSLLLAVVDSNNKMWINCQFINSSGTRRLNQYNSFGNSKHYPEELDRVKEELILDLIIRPYIKDLKALKEYKNHGEDVLYKVNSWYRMKKFTQFLKDRGYSDFPCVRKLSIKKIFYEKKGQKQFAFLKKE